LRGVAYPAENTQQQIPLKQMTLTELGEVEVTTVTKEPEEAWRTPAAVYVITQADIERSGATNIPEALRLAPGVEVAQINSNRWAIGIRGFGGRFSRDVLVLIDGRSVYSTLLAGTYWEAQNLPLQDVDRIEVVRGPGGTIWGPNAVNGVINIITKSSTDTHGDMVSAGGGNVDQGSFVARHGASPGKNFDYRIYGMGFVRGPEFHVNGDNYDRWRDIQGGFRADFTRSNRDRYMVQGELYTEGVGEDVTAATYSPPYSQTLDGTAPVSGGNLTGRWHRIQGAGKDMQLEAYYDWTKRNEPNFAESRNTFDLDFLHRFPLPAREQLSWGFGVRFSKATDPTIISGLYFLPMTRTDELYSGFVRDEIGLVRNRLSLTLGTKLLKTNYTGLELQPTARLLWTPSTGQSLWAAFTHAVRTPSAAERAFYLSGFIGFGPGGIPYFARFNANPDFGSEQLNGYELGYRRLLWSRVYFSVTGFYNHYHDLFSEDIVGAPYLETTPAPVHYLLPAEFGNGLLGTTKGLEFAPEWNPTSFWQLRASYSYLQMNLTRSPNSLDVGTASIIEGSSPHHEASVQSGFDLTKSLNLDLTYRYVSALRAQMVKPYSTGDVRFGWKLRPSLEFSVVGRNLFQPYHFEFASDPGPIVGIRRSVYAEVTWRRVGRGAP
jgi:iron complex outermembrane receptor protein